MTRPRRFVALACAASALIGLALPRLAAAQAPAQAVENPDALIRQGLNRRHLGDNQGAYRLFMRAYSAQRTPKAAAQLGSCEFEIGLWVEAESHITEALRAANDDWVNANREPLIQVLNNVRKLLGRLEVVGRPAGAEVEVAGRSVGRLPLDGPLRVAKGEIAMRVTAAGHRPFQRTVTVAANELAQVVVELDRIAPGEAAVVQPLRPVVRNPYGVPAARDPGQLLDHPAAATADWRVPAAWASAGVAALLGTGAAIGAYLAYSNTKQFNDYTNAPNTANKRCNQRALDEGGGRCPGWLSAAENARTLALASGVGAGAAALAAVIFFTTAPRASGEGQPQARNTLPCLPSPGTLGAACAWTF
jgi:tetratricopeptide (TPR) repeat protein